MFRKLALLFIIISLSLFVIEPFSVYADTQLSAPFLGVNVNAYGVDHWGGKFNIGKINLTAYDPQNEVGNIRGRLECQTWDPTGGCKVFQGNNTVTNGLHMTIPEIYVAEQATNGSITGETASYIYEYEFVFDSYYVGYFVATVNQTSYTVYVNGTQAELTTIQNTTSEFSVTITDYELNLLDSNKQNWVFPIESFGSIQYLYNQGFTQVGINQYNNALYPIFKRDTNGYVVNNNISTNTSFIVILFTDRQVYSVSTFNNQFTYNSNINLVSNEAISSSAAGYIRKVTFTNNSGSSQALNLQNANSNGTFTVFYATPLRDTYAISTDFAIEFALNNVLLDNLDIITNGTTQSNNVVTEFNDTSDNMNDTISDYNELENSFNEDFNDAIENIDVDNNGLNMLGSGFLNSANWVKTQFDTLTYNTPYGSILGFSLVLGIALLIIGRVLG